MSTGYEFRSNRLELQSLGRVCSFMSWDWFWKLANAASLSFAFFPFRPLAVFWGLKNGVMVVQKSDNTALRSETLENWKSSWLLLTQWDDCLRGTKTSVWEIKYSEIGLLQESHGQATHWQGSTFLPSAPSSRHRSLITPTVATSVPCWEVVWRCY